MALLSGLAILVVSAWACVAAWVWYDARANGGHVAAGWSLAVFVTGPPGLLAYLALGSPAGADASWP
jgi:hypothetical protein